MYIERQTKRKGQEAAPFKSRCKKRAVRALQPERTEDMFVIAGLGNPDRKYEKTRHNIGFDAIDRLAGKHQIRMDRLEHKAAVGSGYIEGQKVLLVKPLTFMNLSGSAIAPILNYYKLDPAEDLIVLVDDVSLEPGFIRVRKKGSAGGHNGLKDIIAKCGSSDFPRVRIGVGEKPKEWDLADYVLGHFSQEDRALVEEALDDAAAAVELMLAGRTDEAMNRFNHRKKAEAAPEETGEKETAE